MKRSAAVLLVVLSLPLLAHARVGGGQSYSGSRSSSSSSRSSSSSSSSFTHSSSSSPSWGSHSSSSSPSSSSSSYSNSSGSGYTYSRSYTGSDISGSCGTFFFFLIVVAIIVVIAFNRSRSQPVYSPDPELERAPPPPPVRRSPAATLRQHDPTFSEPVFLEWATLLFTRAQEARGQNLSVVAPWFDDVPRALPPAIAGQPVKGVRGVVVGNARLADGTAGPQGLRASVAFRACLTAGEPARSFYLEETWVFRRAPGVKSRVPEMVESLCCPGCGAPFERDKMGTCDTCGLVLTPGASDWAVAKVQRTLEETRPPLLTGEVQEEGTQLRTVVSPTLQRDRRKLETSEPSFSWKRFEDRAKTIFLNLQHGWSEQKLDALRPYEAESVFQTHRFWLEEYARQGLRNKLGQVALSGIEIVKVTADACYEAITCRMRASMIDVTVGKNGAVVAGNPRRPRPFTEYWTFLRRPGAKAKEGASDTQCPSCGAPLKVSQAGVCEYCSAKVTSGKFDWVLSRIDQDEEYQG